MYNYIIKYKFLKTLIVTVLICCGFSVYGQKQTLQFSKLTIDDGLSQSYINCILQDQLGYIWIGTQDGLNRYDGQTFEVYQNQYNDEKSLSNNYVKAFVEDNKGNIWIGTDRGLNKFDFFQQKLERWHFESTNIINMSSIVGLAVDRKNYLWVATEKNGLFRIDTKTKEAEKIDLPPFFKGKIDLLYIAPSNKIFISSNQGDVASRNLNSDLFEKINVAQGAKVNAIKAHAKRVYFATSQGVHLLEGNSTISIENDLSQYEIMDVEFSNSTIWAASQKDGLIKYQIDKRTIEVYSELFNNQKNLTSSYLTTVFRDHAGIIWLGTEKGVSKFDSFKQGFNHIKSSVYKQQGLLDDEVWTFLEDPKNNLWVGTKTAVSKYDQSKEAFVHYPFSLNSEEDNSVFDLFYLDSTKLYVAAMNGFYQLSIEGSSYHYDKIDYLQNKANERVYKINRFNDSLILFSTRSGVGYLNLSNGNIEFKKQSNNSFGSGGVKHIFQANDQWYIIPNAGVYSIDIDKNGAIKIEKAFEELFKDNRVFTYAVQTDENSIWFGTYGAGLIHYNLKKKEIIHHYTERNGLPNNVIYTILPEGNETVWVSTNRGLARVHNDKIKKFTQEDGLQSNEFNSGSAMKSKNGVFYFGGINGYNWFIPQEITKNPIPPITIIQDIHIFNSNVDSLLNVGMKQAVQVSDQIILKHNQNSITFHLGALHFSDPSENKFKLMLEGVDEDFRIINEPTITYTALPPGEYKLIVSSANSDGEWSKPITFSVKILTPFWATWWFRVLAVIIITIFIIYAYRKRIDNIRRQKIKLELKIVERTRELREKSKKIAKQKKEVENINKKIKEQNQLLEKEKEKVEQLLLNILPEDTARELRDKGKARARNYRKVSIMFTDFVGFTNKAEDYTPSELVEKLDGYFSKFDAVIEKYNLEKIKTIGDAYMCAGGIPIRNKTNPIETVLAGLEIQHIIHTMKKEAKENDDPIWDLRIGINTGEIVAGVIGSKRFAYDIWGQAVNLANRMETHGEPGKVNVSEKTFDFIEPYFECTYRGKIKTKSAGYVNMYFVDGIKPELSEDNKGVVPNDKFWKIVNLHNFSSINYMKAERFIMKKLEKKLSPKLYYHSIEHTKDVTKAAERLAIMEGITDEGLFLLKSAATYHDAGFVEQYDHNEPIGVRMSREILPKYGYTDEQIEVIAGLIYATKIPHKPTTLLQEIICDADLDYLGREDFHEIADKLRLELREHGKIDSDRMWDEIQVKFLTQHQYFTDSAIKLRQKLKEKHIEDIKQKLREDNYKD